MAMRYLILGDVHGNWEALRAVLEDSPLETVDGLWILGDLVGYGPQPNEVVEAIADCALPTQIVRGNHDRAVCGLSSFEGFNEVARRTASWTSRRLSQRHRDYLRELPSGPVKVGDGVVICHGSPGDEDDYILGVESAVEAFRWRGADLVFFGHTHLPSCFIDRAGEIELALMRDGAELTVQTGERYLLNPGSVGQPRDRDPRAAYMTYCERRRTVAWHRVAYPVETTVRRLHAAGLPQAAAARLFVGE